MIFYVVIKILLILFLCIWSSVTDIKTGIISNRIIAIIATFGITINIIGWIFIDSSYLIVQLINIGTVWLISILMYAFHIWAGGDCKLMMAVALLIPYELYALYLNENVSLVLALAFTFVFGYVYLLYDTIRCAIKHKKIINKNIVIKNIKSVLFKWVCCVVYITLIDQLISYAFSSVISKFSWILILINICIVLIVTGIGFLRNKFLILGVFIAGIVVKILFGQPLFNVFMIINYALAVLFIVLRVFINEYDYETIETSKVEKGMILSLTTTLQFSNSKVTGLPSPSTEDLRSRLTEEEAESVRKWAESKHGSNTVVIVRKMPFAVFISLGAVSFMIMGALTR